MTKKCVYTSFVCLTLILAAPPKHSSAQPAASSVRPAETLQTRVTQFVALRYHHGIPYEQARSLGPGALPTLKRLLADENYKSSWTNIVTTIAFIGDPSGFAILRSFVWDRFKGEVDLPTFQALLGTQSGMGAVKGPDALDYLVSGTDPAFWKDIPWTFEHDRGPKLQILLSKVSINGLSITGSPRAGVVLEKLKRSPLSERQIPNIDEGLSRHKEIVEHGQLDYLRSHNR